MASYRFFFMFKIICFSQYQSFVPEYSLFVPGDIDSESKCDIIAISHAKFSLSERLQIDVQHHERRTLLLCRAGFEPINQLVTIGFTCRIGFGQDFVRCDM